MNKYCDRRTWRQGVLCVAFCLLFGLAAQKLSAAELPDLASMKSNSQNASNERATLFADQFHYEDETGKLVATGNVIVWYGTMTLTAQSAEADLENNWVHASGDVVLVEDTRKIKCAKLDYDLKNRSAKMHGILFATYPWYYQGESVEKEGEKKVGISKARFTTCNARHPHYHLTAKQIDIVLGESLTAHHAVVYVGTTPLFYLPWIQRSLKDKRPPFSIRVGYNDFEGAYAKLRFNYFLLEDNYGAVLLDFMEKKGIGVGLEQHVQYALLGKGSGDLSVLYINDKEQEAERWTANLNHRHEFSDRDLLQTNVDYISDRTFNREFSLNLVDTFQQKSYLSYSHRADGYFFSVGASDVESLDPVEDKYYPSERQLPAATFSLSSFKLLDFTYPVYFGLSSSLTRRYESLTAHRYRYRDDFSVNPSFTETITFPLRVPTQPSLSGSLSFPVDGLYKEEYFPAPGDDGVNKQSEMNAAYNTQVTLTNKWVNYRYTKPTHLFQTRLSHGFMRKFPLLQAMNQPRAGVLSNRLGMAGDYYLGDFFTSQLETGYKLELQEEKSKWQERMDPLNFNGRAQLSSKISLTWQGAHSWEQDRITSAFVSGNLYEKIWNLSCTGSYSYTGNNSQPNSIFGTLNGGYNPGIGVSFNSMLQYDFMKKEFTNFALNVMRDLHCWDMQAGFKIYSDGKLELSLGINLKAFPEVKVGMGGPSGVSMGE